MTDGKFFKSFSLMLFLLIVLTVVLVVIGIIAASDVDSRLAAEKQQQTDQLIAKRIAPAGTLAISGEAVLVAQVAATSATASATSASAASAGVGGASASTGETSASSTEVSGQRVYEMSCALCHAQGVGGAPVVGNSEVWTARIAQGMELLVERAINGYQGSAGYMPPKGGNPTLSDAQIAAAVQYMVEQSP